MTSTHKFSSLAGGGGALLDGRHVDALLLGHLAALGHLEGGALLAGLDHGHGHALVHHGGLALLAGHQGARLLRGLGALLLGHLLAGLDGHLLAGLFGHVVALAAVGAGLLVDGGALLLVGGRALVDAHRLAVQALNLPKNGFHHILFKAIYIH